MLGTQRTVRTVKNVDAHVTSFVADFKDWSSWMDGDLKAEKIKIFDIAFWRGDGFMALDDSAYKDKETIYVPVSCYIGMIMGTIKPDKFTEGD